MGFEKIEAAPASNESEPSDPRYEYFKTIIRRKNPDADEEYIKMKARLDLNSILHEEALQKEAVRRRIIDAVHEKRKKQKGY